MMMNTMPRMRPTAPAPEKNASRKNPPRMPNRKGHAQTRVWKPIPLASPTPMPTAISAVKMTRG
jgi:hypothetical protein